MPRTDVKKPDVVKCMCDLLRVGWGIVMTGESLMLVGHQPRSTFGKRPCLNKGIRWRVIE